MQREERDIRNVKTNKQYGIIIHNTDPQTETSSFDKEAGMSIMHTPKLSYTDTCAGETCVFITATE